MEKFCKNCEYWKNNQRELEFSDTFGFCMNDLRSDFEGPMQIKTVPHEAFSNIHHEHLNQDGSLMEHKYELATASSFGCIHFKSR